MRNFSCKMFPVAKLESAAWCRNMFFRGTGRKKCFPSPIEKMFFDQTLRRIANTPSFSSFSWKNKGVGKLGFTLIMLKIFLQQMKRVLGSPPHLLWKSNAEPLFWQKWGRKIHVVKTHQHFGNFALLCVKKKWNFKHFLFSSSRRKKKKNGDFTVDLRIFGSLSRCLQKL